MKQIDCRKYGSEIEVCISTCHVLSQDLLLCRILYHHIGWCELSYCPCVDFSNIPPFIVDKFICNEPCGILGRGDWKRGTEAKCKNEIWQTSLFFSKTFLDKERYNKKKSVLVFFIFLWKKNIQNSLEDCPFSVECHSSLSVKGPKNVIRTSEVLLSKWVEFIFCAYCVAWKVSSY